MDSDTNHSNFTRSIGSIVAIIDEARRISGIHPGQIVWLCMNIWVRMHVESKIQLGNPIYR